MASEYGSEADAGARRILGKRLRYADCAVAVANSGQLTLSEMRCDWLYPVDLCRIGSLI